MGDDITFIQQQEVAMLIASVRPQRGFLDSQPLDFAHAYTLLVTTPAWQGVPTLMRIFPSPAN